MKVTGIETHYAAAQGRPWILIKVMTDEGIYGWGEATLEGKERAVIAAVGELARYLEGKDASRIEQHWHEMYRGAFWVGGPVLNTAISAVDHALWDIKGKALGVPVYELLGGKCRDRIRAYANGWSRGAQSPEEFAERALEVVAMGYTAIKWDPFKQAGLFIDTETANAAVANVRAVREAVGPNVDLCIEVHGRLSPANAIRVGKRLEEFNPFFYEEPIPPENMDSLALVARAVNIPIATGERLFTKWGFKDLFERQAAAIIQPDICHAGGILELKKIAAMAETYYIGFAPHNPNGPICTAASIQVDAATPNFLIQEFVISDEPLRSQLQQEPYKVVDGHFEIPNRPGLGVEINEEYLDRDDLVARDMYSMIQPKM